MKNVLLVDDEPAYLLSLADGLRHFYNGLNVVIAHNGSEAADVLLLRQIDLVITDLGMPEFDGFRLINHISRSHPNTPVFVVSALSNGDLPEKLSGMGVKEYFEKPVEFLDIARKIGHALNF